MADSHFSNLRDRSSNRNRSSSHFRKPPSHNKSLSQHQFDKPSNQPQSDRLSSQSHNKFPNNQSQRQQFEFSNKFFKFFQGVQNKFFIIDENLEYINDCFEQYVEKSTENHVL